MTNPKGCIKSAGVQPRGESDIRKLTAHMSPESRKIAESMMWAENGFVPSFKATDAILLKASRRTYEQCAPHK